MGKNEEVALLRSVLDVQLQTHPLPWRIERDWAFEVIAADGTCVAKYPTQAEAEALLALARSHQKQRAA